MPKTNRRRFLALASAGTAGLILSPGTARSASPAAPRDDAPLPGAAKADELLRQARRKWEIPGLAAGLSRHGRRAFAGYGRSGAQAGGPPGPDTIFEIGSITKTMTGLLLARAVLEDGLELAAPLADSLPQGFSLSEEASRITWLDVATHTSGLPVVQDNLTGADPYNPFFGYTEARLREYLARASLSARPGESWVYSNIGAGLTGWLLAKAKGMSYASLLKTAVLAPLGLTDSAIALEPDQLRRLAQGHDAKGRPMPVWEVPVIEGAGALRSSPRDLLRYAEAHLAGRRAVLDEAMDMAVSPRLRKPGDDKVFMGLFWLVIPSPRGEIVCHQGKSGSMNSFVAIQRRTGSAVVLLANKAPEEDVLPGLGLSLIEALNA